MLFEKHFLVQSSLPFVADYSANTVGLVTDVTITNTTDQVGLLNDATSTHGCVNINRSNDSTCPECVKGSEPQVPNATK